MHVNNYGILYKSCMFFFPSNEIGESILELASTKICYIIIHICTNKFGLIKTSPLWTTLIIDNAHNSGAALTQLLILLQ